MPAPSSTPPLYAAVDMGSNSFRLEIARFEHGHLERVAYLKETVRLGNGLDQDRNITEPACTRALDCLRRFAERLHGFAPANVRAVATQTVREAKNREAFLALASRALGYPIETIAGTEEARLIYLGVIHHLPHSPQRRFVMDIGGRSTELIVGQNQHIYHVHSFRIGSVSWSMKHFASGNLSAKAFDHAITSAQALVETALVQYNPEAWDIAYGSSGTVGAVADLLAAQGAPQGQISLDSLRDLRLSMQRAGHIDKLQIPGLKDDRRPVIAGGISVLQALMQLLSISTLHVAQGALRHGVLLALSDTQQQAQGEDTRERSVTRLWRKLGVDREQAQRVQHYALQLYDQLQPKHTIAQGQHLRYAAQLHEIGAVIGLADYHKHSAYIVLHAELPGFSMTELERLGLLVLGQKGKLKKLGTTLHDESFVNKLLCLRLALIFCHAHKTPTQDFGQLDALPKEAANKGWRLRLPPLFAHSYPLTQYLLQTEAEAWAQTPWQLQVVA